MHITIIGIGLIGGSMALRLRKAGLGSHFIGVEINPEHASRALELGLVDEIKPLEEAIMRSELIILAIPVDAIAKELPSILDMITNQVVIETGSTKVDVLRAISEHPKRTNLVSTHPMAGTEFTGPDAALEDLFDGKCVVFVDEEKSDDRARAVAHQIYRALRMYAISLEARAHDLHAAYVSHISHITSFALALTVLHKEKDEERIFELASGGFSSTVRLAKSSPAMWAPIFLQNKENVLDVLEEHIHQLQTFKNLLINRDSSALYAWMEEANDIRRILQ